MFKALFNVMIGMIASIVQLVCTPLNLAITSALPDLSEKILQVTTALNTVFNGMAWALGMVPASIINTLIFILTIEIAKHTIYISTHALVKVWVLIQKLKFW